MTNKIISRLILPALCLVSLTLGSCSWEQEDLFELSASQRLDKATQDVRSLLSSAPQGWIMEYYYGGIDLIYGGTPIAMSFTKDGLVTVRTLFAIDEPVTSLYSIKTDDNLSLNFDTFNANFHHFSDSDSPDGAGYGTGLEGDYEFIIDKYSAEEIVLTGKKHYGRIKMHPLEAPAEEYLRAASEAGQPYLEIPAVYGLTGTINGQEATGTLGSQQYLLLTIGEETRSIPFMFTDKGISIYEPVTFGEYTITDLSFNAETETFSSSDGKVSLGLERNPLGLKKAEYIGTYIMSYTTSGNKQKEKEVELIDGGGSSVILRGMIPDTDLFLQYDNSQGVLMLNSQNLGGSQELAAWNTTGPLTWDRAYGMMTSWNGEEDSFVLTFVHNGKEWMRDGKLIPVNAFIIWDTDINGESQEFEETRFWNLKLTRI